MKIVNSVCSSLVFPKSRNSLDEFRHMAEFLSAMGMDCLEFYFDGYGRNQIGNVLSDTGLDSVYIAVIPSKESELFLCDTNDSNRQAAIDMFCNCIEEAQANGISRVMINSGKAQSDHRNSFNALENSVEALFNYAASKNYKDFALTLEPCDSNMEAFHLIGGYKLALNFAQRMHTKGLPLEITLDTAHSAEEGEDFATALSALKPYCNHIHFANCNITEQNSPFFGDKHLGFEYPNTVWSAAALRDLTTQISTIYKEDDQLQIGLEFLCREDDPYKYFEKMWELLPFIHKEAPDNRGGLI